MGPAVIRFPCGCSYSDQRFIDGVEICKEHRDMAFRLVLAKVVVSMRDGTWPHL